MTARVIAVANNKGGVGKTTTAGNLAYGLSRSLIVDGEITGRVLIVDLDPQGNQADLFGVRSRVYSMAKNPEGACISAVLKDPLTSVGNYMIPLDRPGDGLNRPNLFLIPATAEITNMVDSIARRDAIAGYDASMSRGRAAQVFKPELATILSNRLGRFLDRFEYIILDCPPKLDSLKTAVYHFADEVIVPVMPDKLSLVGIDQHTADLYEQRKMYKAKARLTIVLPTRVNKQQVLARQVMEDLHRKYKGAVADPIPDSVRVKESPAAGGRCLFEYAPDSDPAVAYTSLIGRVING